MKIRYARIMENDVVDGEGICVSFWTQGCPHHCPGCHNKETWNFDGGIEADSSEIIDNIIQYLGKNGIKRNLSILGGEPLCKENRDFIYELVKEVRAKYNDILIYLWSGYTFYELAAEDNANIKYILDNINFLIEGRYEEGLRDITLKLRGSSNQKIYTNIKYDARLENYNEEEVEYQYKININPRKITFADVYEK